MHGKKEDLNTKYLIIQGGPVKYPIVKNFYKKEIKFLC